MTSDPTVKAPPPWIEECDGFIREWSCTPVLTGIPFRVLQGAWNEDQTVYRIYEVALPDD